MSHFLLKRSFARACYPVSQLCCLTIEIGGFTPQLQTGFSHETSAPHCGRHRTVTLSAATLCLRGRRITTDDLGLCVQPDDKSIATVCETHYPQTRDLSVSKEIRKVRLMYADCSRILLSPTASVTERVSPPRRSVSSRACPYDRAGEENSSRSLFLEMKDLTPSVVSTTSRVSQIKQPHHNSSDESMCYTI